VAITADEQTVSYETPIGAGGFVRVEVRGEPFFGGPEAPLASRTDLEAFSNPVFLRLGPPPVGTQADLTAPPARRPAAAGGAAGLSPGIGRRHATAPPTSTRLPSCAIALESQGFGRSGIVTGP